MAYESMLEFPDTLQVDPEARAGVGALPSVFEFRRDALNPLRYARLGPGWALAVVDVVGSTELARNGQDREVNFVAGAAVAALTAALSETASDAASPTIPACQFTGDGALAAVPPGRAEAVQAVLGALVHWAADAFGITLRAGLVPVGALRERGLQVLAALHDFGGGNAIGFFLGDGVDAADAWVKADPRWQAPAVPGPVPGLEGLSCRWNPVPPQRGTVLCVIADPTVPGVGGVAALKRVLAAIEAVVPGDVAAPLGDGSRLQPRAAPAWRALRLESRAAAAGQRLARVAQALLGALFIRLAHAWGGRLGPVDAGAYRRAMAERSDCRKLAGGVRLVLDVTLQEAERIEALLAAQEATGALRCGTSRAEAVTITCMVGDFMADRHVHFVDGSGLGFWRAAQALKAKARAGSPGVAPRSDTRRA